MYSVHCCSIIYISTKIFIPDILKNVIKKKLKVVKSIKIIIVF